VKHFYGSTTVRGVRPRRFQAYDEGRKNGGGERGVCANHLVKSGVGVAFAANRR
jgi:hypothetical protein